MRTRKKLPGKLLVSLCTVTMALSTSASLPVHAKYAPVTERCSSYICDYPDSNVWDATMDTAAKDHELDLESNTLFIFEKTSVKDVPDSSLTSYENKEGKPEETPDHGQIAPEVNPVDSENVTEVKANLPYEDELPSVLVKPSIKHMKNTSGKQIHICWKKVKYADGYQIQYSRKSNFANTKTINLSKNKSSFSVKESKGKTYYVRMRAYKNVDHKKIYSSWTSVKKIKIRK